MMGEKRNAPELRFEGTTCDWETSKVSSIFQLNAGGDVPKDNVSKKKVERFQYPIYANASENKGIYGYSDKYKISPPALTIAGRGVYIGVAHLRLEKFYPIVRLLVLKAKDHKKVDLGFFEYAFNNLNIFIESTGVPQLTAPQLSTYSISYPTLPEQQKISSFLTAVDRRIELLERKLEKLERYKKGVMQQIFPSTGSGQVPKIRFKQEDGSDFPDWEEKKLGEVYEFRTTNSLSRDKLNYDSGKFRNVHYGDIHTKFSTLLDLKTVGLPFVNEDVVIRKSFSENLVEDGDLLIADASEDYADIGKTVEVVNVQDKKVLAGLHTLHAKRKSDKMTIGFGGFLMKTQAVRNQVMKIAQGTKVLSISVTRISDLNLMIPCEGEQKKIVIFLKNLDENTEKLSLQINQMQIWKKGLLQKMFV